MSVILILSLIFPALISFWGWQVFSGKEDWYQILYGRWPRMDDEFIAKHHRLLGLSYFVSGLLASILLLVLALSK